MRVMSYRSQVTTTLMAEPWGTMIVTTVGPVSVPAQQGGNDGAAQQFVLGDATEGLQPALSTLGALSQQAQEVPSTGTEALMQPQTAQALVTVATELTVAGRGAEPRRRPVLLRRSVSLPHLPAPTSASEAGVNQTSVLCSVLRQVEPEAGGLLATGTAVRGQL